MHTDVNACDCTRACTDTVGESALKVDSGRKIPCHTGESNLCRQRAGPILYQLSYVPTPVKQTFYLFVVVESLVCVTSMERYYSPLFVDTCEYATIGRGAKCRSERNPPSRSFQMHLIKFVAESKVGTYAYF